MVPVLFSIGTGSALFFFLHLWIWRRNPSVTPRMVLLGTLGIVGTCASLLVYWVLRGSDLIGFCSILWTELSLLVFYLFFYGGICRSVSLTLLTRLLAQNGRPLDFRSFIQEYSVSSRFEDRVRVMDEVGYVRLEGDRVILTPKGRRAVRLAAFLAGLIGDGLQG